MTTTTQLFGYAHYTKTATPEDSVRDYLGDQESDFDVEGLTHAYREAINDALDGTGIVLRGSDFYSNYPSPDDAKELIEGAIESVDLADLAPRFDLSAAVLIEVSATVAGQDVVVKSAPFDMGEAPAAARWIEILNELHADPTKGVVAGANYRVTLRDADGIALASVNTVAREAEQE